MGDYDGAAEIYEQIVAWEQRSLGPEHPDTANSLHYLASLYNEQGLYLKAEPIFLRVLAIHKKVLDPEHPDTARTINNLALLYDNQGLYTKAELLYSHSLVIREKALGPEHPDNSDNPQQPGTFIRQPGVVCKSRAALSACINY